MLAAVFLAALVAAAVSTAVLFSRPPSLRPGSASSRPAAALRICRDQHTWAQPELARAVLLVAMAMDRSPQAVLDSQPVPDRQGARRRDAAPG